VPTATTTIALDPFTPHVTTTTMDPFSFATNGTMGDPFQLTKPNTTMSITFPLASNPPNGPFQPNATIDSPFALASTIKHISNSFSFGVQTSNVSFNTINVSTFDLPTTNAPPIFLRRALHMVQHNGLLFLLDSKFKRS
jgi:hypothetical protein